MGVCFIVDPMAKPCCQDVFRKIVTLSLNDAAIVPTVRVAALRWWPRPASYLMDQNRDITSAVVTVFNNLLKIFLCLSQALLRKPTCKPHPFNDIIFDIGCCASLGRSRFRPGIGPLRTLETLVLEQRRYFSVSTGFGGFRVWALA